MVVQLMIYRFIGTSYLSRCHVPHAVFVLQVATPWTLWLSWMYGMTRCALTSRNVAVKAVYVTHLCFVVHVFTIWMSRNTIDWRICPAALLQVFLAIRRHFGFVHPARMGCDLSHYWGYYLVYVHYFMCISTGLCATTCATPFAASKRCPRQLSSGEPPVAQFACTFLIFVCRATIWMNADLFWLHYRVFGILYSMHVSSIKREMILRPYMNSYI